MVGYGVGRVLLRVAAVVKGREVGAAAAMESSDPWSAASSSCNLRICSCFVLEYGGGAAVVVNEMVEALGVLAEKVGEEEE